MGRVLVLYVVDPIISLYHDIPIIQHVTPSASWSWGSYNRRGAPHPCCEGYNEGMKRGSEEGIYCIYGMRGYMRWCDVGWGEALAGGWCLPGGVLLPSRRGPSPCGCPPCGAPSPPGGVSCPPGGVVLSSPVALGPLVPDPIPYVL